ncbi:hypothetical protein [Brachybacterium tyrofermentans]|uniref:hypothetical protein n=1 Tax=Brachybacterium tyrofermentans TaxID=47848 RepID=UPI001868AF28|nr:hypothetical protein [Brachybacterium tyrofermentans]
MSAENHTRIELTKRWGLALAALLVILIVGVVLALHEPSEIPMPPDESSANSSHTDRDLVVREDVEAVVPATVRAANGEFAVKGAESYLVELEISVTKLADTPGAEMYLSFSLNCSGAEGGASGSAGGTQNFITGEFYAVRNQMVLEPTVDDAVTCNVLLTSPNPEAAAAGASFTADIQWRMTPIEGMAVEDAGEDRLPRAVSPGGRDVVLSSTTDIRQLNASSLNLLTSLHLTTCSTVNGSRENSKYWCNEAHVDENGSTYDLILRADVLRDDGTPCAELSVSTNTSHLDQNRHHQVVSLRDRVNVPKDTCGKRLRITVIVDNEGPAPLIVHGVASSLVIVESQ